MANLSVTYADTVNTVYTHCDRRNGHRHCKYKYTDTAFKLRLLWEQITVCTYLDRARAANTTAHATLVTTTVSLTARVMNFREGVLRGARISAAAASRSVL